MGGTHLILCRPEGARQRAWLRARVRVRRSCWSARRGDRRGSQWVGGTHLLLPRPLVLLACASPSRSFPSRYPRLLACVTRRARVGFVRMVVLDVG